MGGNRHRKEQARLRPLEIVQAAIGVSTRSVDFGKEENCIEKLFFKILIKIVNDSGFNEAVGIKTG